MQHPAHDLLEFIGIVKSSNALFFHAVGSPALLYKSQDQGKNWAVVYEEQHLDAFYDAIAFWGAKSFRAFILDELVPEIERNYRTTNRRGIIGESLAGLFVVETFLLKPGAFDFYIAMDPSLWWNDNFLVKNAAKNLNELPEGNSIKLWFAGSNTTDIFEYTRQFAELLQQEQLKGLDWKYSDEPNEKHNTIFRATKEKALIWTIGE